MKKIAAFLFFGLVAGASVVWALDAPVDESLAKAADNHSYAVKVPGMVAHGVYQIAETPFEPLFRPYEETVSKGNHAFGWLRGINRGVFNILEGLTNGLFNIVRAPVPGMGRYENKGHQTTILPDPVK